MCSESCRVERAEAEAIYDAGREACVEFILGLAGEVGQHAERLRRLEEQARQARAPFKAAIRGSAEDATAATSGGAPRRRS